MNTEVLLCDVISLVYICINVSEEPVAAVVFKAGSKSGGRG
jgi:hypothetical protein